MAPLSRGMYRSVRGTYRVEGKVHVAGGERHTIKNFICRMLQRVSGLSGKGSEQVSHPGGERAQIGDHEKTPNEFI